MRAFLTAIAIALIVAAAVVIAGQPGHVAIAWGDWRLDPPIPVFVAALITAAAALLLLAAIARRVLAGPGALLRARRERRRRAGYRALTQGMVAVAAGDVDEARRQAKKADVLLAEPPLTLLLSAQAAQLGGDEAAARHYFSEMLARPETEFLGLRGLLTQALRAGDEATALRLVTRARALRPKTPWVLTHLLELQVRAGAWEPAEQTLAEAAKAELVPAGAARRQRAVLLAERSEAAEARGDASAALALAGQAQELAPGFAPVAARRARLLREAGRQRPAAKALETAWRQAPHPLLAEEFAALLPDAPPLARLKRFEALAATNPGHVESHVAAARAALEAQLWGEARRHLHAAGARPVEVRPDGAGAASPASLPPARICRLMAELEEAEHGDGAAARAWLARATAAPPDPVWLCGKCAAESLAWQPLCPRCRGFDTLDWQVSPRAVALPSELPPIALPPAPDLLAPPVSRPAPAPASSPASGPLPAPASPLTRGAAGA